MKSAFRRFALSITLAMSAIIAMSGIALAGTAGVTVQNVWGSAGAFGAYANFDAHWAASQRWVGTTQTWTVSNLEMTALIKGGRNCDPIYCSGWGYTATANFYDWNNKKVLSVTLPGGACYAHATSPSDLLLSRCKAGSFSFSVSKPSVLTLTKMTLTWSVGLLVDGTLYFGDRWHYSKSVTLNQT